MKAQLAFAKYDVTVGDLPPLAADARSRTQAMTLAVVAHGLLVALVLWGLGPVAAAPMPPLVRLVFVEPPPPPPPPLGAAQGAGSLAALPVEPAAVEAAAEAPVKVPVKVPVVEEPKRIVAPRKRLRAAQPPKAQARAQAPAAVAAVAQKDVQRGSVAGTASGVAEGVAGGVSGGTAGGVVGGRGHGPVPAGQVAHPPSLISRVMPQYPRAARMEGVEGLVLLEAILNIDGRIEPDIKVLSSLPDLDAAAIAALRRWRFKPARNEQGQTVPVILEVPIRFVMR